VLAEIFVEPVPLPRDVEPLDIGEVTTVAGSAVGPGYWWVTVAVDVTETPAPDGAAGVGDEDGAPAAEPVTATWYIQVAVVGDVEARLAVLTTPAVLPVAPAPPDDWHRVEGASIERGTGPYDTIEGFLRALLVGDGDPTRYMTPGWSIEMRPDPMFADLEIERMSLAADPGDGPLRVRVEVAVDTVGGTRRHVAYTIEAIERDGRWEVVDLPGGPTVHREEGEDAGQSAATTSSLPPSSTEADGSAGLGGSPPDGETAVPAGAPPPGSETPAPSEGPDAVAD
jgi:hypothetical protein